MTFGDLIDTVVSDSGDAGAAYRANAIRWLNLARQEAAALGSWKSAKNSASSFQTDGNTSGIYLLADIDEVIGGQMYDTTSNTVIERDTENTLMRVNVNPPTSGPPVLWADSGMTASGEKQIRLWPAPDDVRTINFLGTRALTDITSANESMSVDPFFGPIVGIGAMLQAGLRYYHDVNNNEDVSVTGRSQGTFHKLIRVMSGMSGVDPNASSRMEPVNRRGMFTTRGRLDPGHYGNH